ncbi:MAG: glycosyltransferase [Pseudomonadota bacterium]
MSDPKLQKLVLLPTLAVSVKPDGRLGVTRKFMDGVQAFQQRWLGPVSVLAEREVDTPDHLDQDVVNPAELPFELKVVDFDRLLDEPALEGAGVVLGSLGFRQNHVVRVCRQRGVPCVLTSEYSLPTRNQIVDAGTRHRLLRMRRHFWERQQEKAQRLAVRDADGLQCNGTPTFEAYATLNPKPLLYFDTRVTRDMLITKEALDTRLAHCRTHQPLRLLFSGRLVPMKGAHDLVEMARHLKGLGVPFELTICGDGESSEAMRTAIATHGLESQVHMVGVLDFHTELMPRVQHQTDLFVCCHPQGDPSCTYLETLSCGVPIVGYDNEAFNGLNRRSSAGWITPLNDPLAMAQRIAVLDRQRDPMSQASHRALQFASQHTFELTFQRRIEHLASCVRSGTTGHSTVRAKSATGTATSAQARVATGVR